MKSAINNLQQTTTRIHVWYIVLHLCDFCCFHVGKYTIVPWESVMGNLQPQVPRGLWVSVGNFFVTESWKDWKRWVLLESREAAKNGEWYWNKHHISLYHTLHDNISVHIPPLEKENHLQKWFGKGCDSSQEGRFVDWKCNFPMIKPLEIQTSFSEVWCF